ncbi:DUF6257 family protein [Streptomyces sp. NPDC088915]|uniref:DUF6257 family protein n=1 Tax=Streptomyces sp. NPDC088915 TaxID=3365912 RepID=UPI003807ED7A
MASKKDTEYDPDYPPLTAREHARIAWNVGRMAKRSISRPDARHTDLESNVNRVIDKARERAENNARKGK